MDYDREPRLKDIQKFGPQFRVYTMRGWILCDDWKEVEVELEDIDSLERKK